MKPYSPAEIDRLPESRIGSKAYNLDSLGRAGFNVPLWFALPAEVYSDHIKDIPFSGNPAQFSDAIIKKELCPNLLSEVEQTLEKLGLQSKLLAVRSSAIGEDGVGASFAGQLSSFLFVPSSHLAESIKKVWASAFTDHALIYFKTQDFEPHAIKVAVVIQEMIDSECSGVVFTVDPVSGNRKAIMVSAVYGLGEGLVSGMLDADVYTVVPAINNTFSIDLRIAEKKQALQFDFVRGWGTLCQPISMDQSKKAVLTNDAILNIAQISRDIATLFGRPQDIEWANIHGVFFVLQARPITTLSTTPDRTQVRRLWDNSNIIESYSGVTTPLTFSFVQDVYTEVYKQFCIIMGVEKKIIEANSDIFSMLGLFKGRIYYNLLNWYKVLSLLPGYSLNATFMEQMMGVREKLEVPPTVIKSSTNKYVQVGTLAIKLIKNLLTLQSQIDLFSRHFAATIAPYSHMSLSSKGAEDLVGVFQVLERALLRRWDAPLVNDFYAMIFYGLLKKVTEKWNSNSLANIHNDLLCGEGGVISTEPIRNIRHIANKILQHKDIHNTWMNTSDAELLAMVVSPSSTSPNAALNDIINLIIAHIERFGDRCVNELKLETVTARMEPTIILRLITSYVKQGYQDNDALWAHEQTIRKKAELQSKSFLRGKPLRQILFSYILKQARTRIKCRENLRFERTRLFALIRTLFITLGKRFFEEGKISNPRDIFFLTKDEIFAAVQGTAVHDNLGLCIEFRKKEYATYVEMSLPDRFETFGATIFGNTFAPLNSSVSMGDTNTLKGTGCCAGIITAKARIVHDPSNAPDLAGCVLVAERTDPGWAPLFPLAKGLLVERGSLLSHSAIVAREMGIPAIVGIDQLLKKIPDGAMVEMDGTLGIVRIISSTTPTKEND